jgi:hypothetical protein
LDAAAARVGKVPVMDGGGNGGKGAEVSGAGRIGGTGHAGVGNEGAGMVGVMIRGGVWNPTGGTGGLVRLWACLVLGVRVPFGYAFSGP